MEIRELAYNLETQNIKANDIERTGVTFTSTLNEMIVDVTKIIYDRLGGGRAEYIIETFETADRWTKRATYKTHCPKDAQVETMMALLDLDRNAEW